MAGLPASLWAFIPNSASRIVEYLVNNRIFDDIARQTSSFQNTETGVWTDIKRSVKLSYSLELGD
jgi:hypothetical protein